MDIDCELSIIIPVYNAEKTINKCLESIVNQLDKLEIIVVDDESEDSTKSIMYSWMERYPFIRYYKKENGGVASSRNYGLKKAKGKYITFVDQDDWLEKNAYWVLVSKMNAINADMLVFGYYKDYENKESIPMCVEEEIPYEIQSVDSLIKYAFYREKYRMFAAFVWNKIFRRAFLLDHHIDFDEGLTRGDDVLFFSKMAVHNPHTIFYKENLYHYYQRFDSITHTFTQDNYYRLKDILTGYDRAIAIVENAVENVDSINSMKSFYVYHASVLYDFAVKLKNTAEQECLKKCMEKYYVEYCEQNKDYSERIKKISKIIGKI